MNIPFLEQELESSKGKENDIKMNDAVLQKGASSPPISTSTGEGRVTSEVPEMLLLESPLVASKLSRMSVVISLLPHCCFLILLMMYDLVSGGTSIVN
jgi:hypothetical protein